MSDRTINFGESETEATYQIQDTDSTGGGNFVVAKDTNANTVLLQYDPATDTWEYAGDVDMNGGNVSGVGTLTAESVNTESATVTNEVDAGSVSTDSATVTNEVDAGSVNIGNYVGDFNLDNVSSDPNNPNYLNWNEADAGGSSNRPIASIAVCGPTITTDNTAQDLISVGSGVRETTIGELKFIFRDTAAARFETVKYSQIGEGLSTPDSLTTNSPPATSYSLDSGMIQIAIDGDASAQEVIAIIVGGLV